MAADVEDGDLFELNEEIDEHYATKQVIWLDGRY